MFVGSNRVFQSGHVGPLCFGSLLKTLTPANVLIICINTEKTSKSPMIPSEAQGLTQLYTQYIPANSFILF